MRLVPVGTSLFAVRTVSGAFVSGKPKYVTPAAMRSGGATSTHALTASCSQRSPSLRPVEPISAMPWPRRLPRLSAHVQVCSMDQPWCTPCAVFITVSGPKGRKEAVGGVLAFSASVWPGGHWCSRYVGITPVRGPDAADQWGARRYPRRPSLQACRNTVAPSNESLDFGIKAGAIRPRPRSFASRSRAAAVSSPSLTWKPRYIHAHAGPVRRLHSPLTGADSKLTAQMSPLRNIEEASCHRRRKHPNLTHCAASFRRLIVSSGVCVMNVVGELLTKLIAIGIAGAGAFAATAYILANNWP